MQLIAALKFFHDVVPRHLVRRHRCHGLMRGWIERLADGRNRLSEFFQTARTAQSHIDPRSAVPLPSWLPDGRSKFREGKRLP